MRSSRLFWGIVIVILGIVLLMMNLGLLPGNLWDVIWPLGLVLLGVWFLLGPVLGRRERETRQLSIPLENTVDAEVRIDHGAGRLFIRSQPDNGNLMDGSFGGGVNADLRHDGGTARLNLSVPGDAFIGFPSFYWQGFNWDVAFNQSLPLRLRLHTGAGESDLDLSNLQVKEITLETGASSTRLTLPSQAGMTRAEIKSGAASMEMRIPETVAARIQVKSGLADIKVDSRRFIRRGDVYESEDYGSAANRADIRVETGVGSVTVR